MATEKALGIKEIATLLLVVVSLAACRGRAVGPHGARRRMVELQGPERPVRAGVVRLLELLEDGSFGDGGGADAPCRPPGGRDGERRRGRGQFRGRPRTDGRPPLPASATGDREATGGRRRSGGAAHLPESAESARVPRADAGRDRHPRAARNPCRRCPRVHGGYRRRGRVRVARRLPGSDSCAGRSGD